MGYVGKNILKEWAKKYPNNKRAKKVCAQLENWFETCFSFQAGFDVFQLGVQIRKNVFQLFDFVLPCG